MSSAFDPAQFLDAITTEAAVKLPPLPIGDYTAVIGELTSRTWTGKTDPTKSGIAFDVTLTLEIPAEVQASLGYSSTYNMKDSIMLDLTAGGTMDFSPGKNGSLRRYREATGLNVPGEAFRPRELQGKAIQVKIKHDIWENEPINKIAGVTKLA